MAITQFPLDPAGLPARYLEASPAEFDGKQTEREGVPVWNCSLLVQIPGQRAETLVVKVPGKTCPRHPELAEVRLVSPVASYWSQNGRSGVSVRAEGIEELHGAPAKAAPANAS